jgi:hypothetical protein
MRGKVAKAIRKSVYGDYSIRGTRYRWDENTPGMVVCIGLRKQYKERKKLHRGVRGSGNG